MKSLKQLLNEMDQPKSEEEKRFKALHTDNVEVVDYVIPQEHVFKGTVERTPRRADGGSEETYDTSYVRTEPVKPMGEETSAKLDGRRKEFREKLKALLYSKMKQEKKVIDKVAEQIVTHMDENAAEEITMLEKQLSFISYAADEIADYIKEAGDPEEWYQNKLAAVHGEIKTLHAYAQGEMEMMGEEEEIEEDLDALFEAAMSAQDEESERQKEYQAFFKAALKRFGVKSPAELKGDKEKEFYDYIDKNWDAEKESD